MEPIVQSFGRLCAQNRYFVAADANLTLYGSPNWAFSGKA
jgi:hypothetical protein